MAVTSERMGEAAASGGEKRMRPGWIRRRCPRVLHEEAMADGKAPSPWVEVGGECGGVCGKSLASPPTKLQQLGELHMGEIQGGEEKKRKNETKIKMVRHTLLGRTGGPLGIEAWT